VQEVHGANRAVDRTDLSSSWRNTAVANA